MSTKSGKSPTPCLTYVPRSVDPCICEDCLWSWGAHSNDTRGVFAQVASATVVSLIEHRWSYVSQIPNVNHCNTFRLLEYNDHLKICQCGRFMHEHNLRVQMRYRETLKQAPKTVQDALTLDDLRARAELKPIRNVDSYPESSTQCRSSIEVDPGSYCMCLERKGHYPTTPHKHDSGSIVATWTNETQEIVRKSDVKRATFTRIPWPCKLFVPKVEAPGTCRNCCHKYTVHPTDSRGTDFEELIDTHSPNCKCVQLPGHHHCNCMTDVKKQELLDALGGKSECAQFKPRNGDKQTDIYCKCNTRFYDHSSTAKNGFGTWTEWRAAHMTNAEVIAWFLGLGTTDQARMARFVGHMDHPSHMDAYAPSPKLIKAMWELLPNHLQEWGRKARKSSRITEMPIDPDSKRDEINTVDSEGRKRCYQCGDVLELSEEIVCSGCISLNLVAEGGGNVGATELGTRQMMSLRGPALVGSKLSSTTDRRDPPQESDAEDHDD